MWKAIQVILIVLGILLVLGSNWVSMPLLLHAGMGSFGLAAIVVGCEAILTQHIVIGTRRRGTRQTYTGLPAVIQGVQFNLLGLFFVGMALILQFDADGRGLVTYIARRPGLAMAALGTLILAQAVVIMVGPREDRDGWSVILFIVRLLPGLILVVLGLALIGLGLFEFTAPVAFDQMGGGLLESLYEVR